MFRNDGSRPIDVEALDRMSGRGSYALTMVCLERVLDDLGLRNPDVDELLNAMWLLVESTYEEWEARAGKVADDLVGDGALAQLPYFVRSMIDGILESAYPGDSQASLACTVDVLDSARAHGHPLPPMEPFGRSSYDGRPVSRVVFLKRSWIRLVERNDD